MSLVEISACGTVLILSGVLLRRWLPKDACMLLWWAAVLRLLTPCALPARWSAYSLLETLAVKPEPAPLGGAPITVLPSLEGVPVPPDAVGAETAAFPLWTALWTAGALLLAVWFLASHIHWRRRFREALPAECGFLASWNPRHPHIRVRVSDCIAAPLTYGLFQPVILLPKTFDLSDDSALLCVLTHECVHIRRLDSLFKLLLSAALCLHWFNPAMWLLWVLAGRDMELRCDQAVLGCLGAERRTVYALTLLRMAELQNESMPLCNSFGAHGMEERILAIMKYKKTSALALTTALALVLCVTAAFATTARKAPSTEPVAGLHDEDAALVLRELEKSVQYDSGTFHFTIPAGESSGNRLNIWISGSVLTAVDMESGMIMSVNYLEDESERGEWVPGKTYSFLTAMAAYDELTLSASYGKEALTLDLTGYLPDGLAPLEVPALPEAKEDIPADAAFIWPLDSTNITSGYGTRHSPGGNGVTVHNGVDAGGPDEGAAIYAAADGTVKETGFDSKYGNYILLDHGGGLESFYSACQSVLVKNGTVRQGQTIATVGQSGASTGPHLHFEIRKNGQAQDPGEYYGQTACPSHSPQTIG